MDANERRARAAAEAAEWWTEMQSEQMPRERRESFVKWLRESPMHVSEMLSVVQVHDALSHFEHWSSIDTHVATTQDTIVEFARTGSVSSSARAIPRTETRRRQKPWLVAGMAASSLLVVGLSLWLNLRGQVIETELGERREVALADGSVLQVDPQTRMRVKLQDSERIVELERGRALFRVAKDPQRPFLVRANGTEARAVGTAFAVEHETRDVVVTVAEGKVAVSVIHPEDVRREPELAALLVADQQLTVDNAGSTTSVRKVNSERELSWTRGRLVFDDTPLRQVVADFNRYNRVQLRIDDAVLGARPVSGAFDASDPESFIAFIRSVAEVNIVRDDHRNVTISAAH